MSLLFEVVARFLIWVVLRSGNRVSSWESSHAEVAEVSVLLDDLLFIGKLCGLLFVRPPIYLFYFYLCLFGCRVPSYFSSSPFFTGAAS